MTLQTYPLFCLGDPLIDMQVANGEDLLDKYDLNANDGIRAGDKHAAIYDDILKNHHVTFVAGGAAQNTARGAAYVLPPNSVVYSGCVGDDALTEQLREANIREGVQEAYLVQPGEKTGACAVVITGQNRSLVTTLRAAGMFKMSHLKSPAIEHLVAAAQFFYVEGYFLTHGIESALFLANGASESGKVFALNLAAPYIPKLYKFQLKQIMPFCDIIFGNEAEAEAYGEAMGLPDKKDLPAIARAISLLPKSNASRPRIVVFTQGALSTVMVSSADVDKPKVVPVQPLSDSDVVDTNGAGDAFAGGFMGALVAGHSLEKAIEVGHELGAMCVQQVGPQYKWPKVAIRSMTLQKRDNSVVPT